jgi:hypothetical protein
MSKREKSTILYSHNGIKIERIDYLDMTKWSNQRYQDKFIADDINTSIKKKESKTEVIAAQKAWDEVITRESKLGFYFYETIHHDAKKPEIKNNDRYGSANFKIYTFQYDNKRFILSYPVSCGDVSINRETRPWDIIPGYKGIDEHFIIDLYKEVNKFFEVVEVNRVAYRIKTAKYGYNPQNEEYTSDMSWIYDVKKKVIIDLFGDENGPTVNYNDIKILSHGFDLKESFRKRKES